MVVTLHLEADVRVRIGPDIVAVLVHVVAGNRGMPLTIRTPIDSLYCASPGWTCPRREAVCASAGVATMAASATAATNDFMIVLRFIEIAPLIAQATFETHSRNGQCTMF